MRRSCKWITKSALREAVQDQFRVLGYSKNGSGYFLSDQLTKQRIRDLHAAHRMERLNQERSFVTQLGGDLVKNFATGRQVDHASIEPELIEVKT